MSDWRDNAWVRVGIFLVVIGLIWLALRYTPAPPKYVSPPYIEQITTAPALIAHCDDISPVSLVFWHASHDDGVYHL